MIIRRLAVTLATVLCFVPTQVNKADDKPVPCLKRSNAEDAAKCWQDADVGLVTKLLKLHDPRVDKILQEYFAKLSGLKMEPPPKVKR